jgi:hypothetical protein
MTLLSVLSPQRNSLSLEPVQLRPPPRNADIEGSAPFHVAGSSKKTTLRGAITPSILILRQGGSINVS